MARSTTKHRTLRLELILLVLLGTVQVLHAFQTTEIAALNTRAVSSFASLLGVAEVEKIPETEVDESVDFPPPLTSLERATRAIEFYKRVLPVLGAYKAKELELAFRRNTLKQTINEEEEEEIWKKIDEWGSSRVAETIQDMKGFYVKTGQVISTRVDLFPEAYTSKLQELQDGLEPMPFELVEKVVRQELLDGAPLSELFATFDREPLGKTIL
eukprot:scaffold8079_cov121-Cylindrotheca_fusiformis.AAC.2